jgi:hypothetical protein
VSALGWACGAAEGRHEGLSLPFLIAVLPDLDTPRHPLETESSNKRLAELSE